MKKDHIYFIITSLILIILIVLSGNVLYVIFKRIINPNVIVTIEDKEIYRGNKWYLTITSAGYDTSVDIRRGFFGFIIDDHYTSKDIKIETINE